MRLSPHDVIGLLVNRPLLAHETTAMTVYNMMMARNDMPQAPVLMNEDFPYIQAHIESVRDRPLGTRSGRTVVQAGIDMSRFDGEMVQSEDGSWRAVEPYLRTRSGTAIISVIGSLVNRGAYVGASSGVTSYEGIGYQLTRAGKDPKSAAIVIDMSTPGGEALGNAEISALVARIAKEKPVYGIANSLSASAGYSILSCCSEAFATPSSLVGSIGCIMLHLDMTEKAKNEGVVPTIISAGDRKADGHPLTKLTPEALAELKAGVNSYYELFVNIVAKGRGAKLNAKKARETEARTYVGKEALDIGLVDDIGTFDDILSAADKVSRKTLGTRKPSQQKGGPMSILNTAHDNTVIEHQPAPGNTAPAPAPVQTAQPAPPAPAQSGFDNRIAAIMDHASVKANGALLAPCLDLARKSTSMSAEDIVSFVSSMTPAAAAQVQQVATQNFQERAQQTGVNGVAPGQGGHSPTGNPSQINGGPAAGMPGSVTAEQAPWGKHVDAANARAKGWQGSHTAPG